MHILIVDDHQLFVDGLTGVLSHLNRKTTIHSANSTSGAQTLLNELDQLDLILLDLNLQGLDGISFLKSMQDQGSEVPVIVVSASEDVNEIKNAMDIGAKGFIPKSYSSAGMLAVVQEVINGGTHLPYGIKEQVFELCKHDHNADTSLSKKLKELSISRRQFKVLELLSAGLNNSEIARSLSLSEHTVKSHVNRLFKALNVSNRVECTLEAFRLGIAKPK